MASRNGFEPWRKDYQEKVPTKSTYTDTLIPNKVMLYKSERLHYHRNNMMHEANPPPAWPQNCKDAERAGAAIFVQVFYNLIIYKLHDMFMPQLWYDSVQKKLNSCPGLCYLDLARHGYCPNIRLSSIWKILYIFGSKKVSRSQIVRYQYFR